ncbi:phosphotransferase family protein [Streptomyces prunicolor]|uniref:phosphotransferase family protein n=1 Tax=Streptomyces prunicolor TaxID=67348 RepID=UPI0033F15A99
MTQSRTEASRTVLEAAADEADLPAHGAEVIRLSENELWRLPGGIVARITRAGQQAAARREIAITRWLAEHLVPAVVPIAMEQPVFVGERAVTFWQELPPHRQGCTADLAPLLRGLHSLPVPAFEIGELDPFVRIETRLARARVLSDDDRAWLLARLAELRIAWADLPAGLPRCIVHGDAWRGNVAVIADGSRILMDFERAAVGQPEWDLTSTASALDTFGSISRDEYVAFCRAYGHDVRVWDGYPVLLGIRELRQVSIAVLLSEGNPVIAEQARFRIACVRGQRGPRPWEWEAVP